MSFVTAIDKAMGIVFASYFFSYFIVTLTIITIWGSEGCYDLVFSLVLTFVSMVLSVWFIDFVSSCGIASKFTPNNRKGRIITGFCFGLSGAAISLALLNNEMFYSYLIWSALLPIPMVILLWFKYAINRDENDKATK